MTRLAWVLFALIVMLCAALGYVAAPLSAAAQLQMHEGLRTTSSIVFGAMGAWLALLLTTTEQARNSGWRGRVGHVLVSMALSGMTLAAVVASSFLAPILSRTDLLQGNRETTLRLSLAITGAITAAQLWAVLLSFLPLLWWSRALLVAERNEKKVRTYLGSSPPTPATDP